MPSSAESSLLLCLSALAAGVVNALAGGGTLLTFPALTTVVSDVVANATSTVALVPGSLAGAWGYRREMRHMSRWLALLVWPSLIGGGVGSLLLTRLDPEYFSALVPWLILSASLLFLSQPLLARWVGIGEEHTQPSSAKQAALVLFQFFVAVYGGYFGAGIGILMLSALSLMGISNIHYMNAAKAVLAACMNGVSVVVFVLEGKVEWHYALTMAIAAVAGGYLGAHFGRRLDRRVVRWIVIAIGFALAGHFFYKQYVGVS
jgi:uncharacterized membrane protein YfcA